MFSNKNIGNDITYLQHDERDYKRYYVNSTRLSQSYAHNYSPTICSNSRPMNHLISGLIEVGVGGRGRTIVSIQGYFPFRAESK
jgi:hypothetical protein